MAADLRKTLMEGPIVPRTLEFRPVWHVHGLRASAKHDLVAGENELEDVELTREIHV